MTRGLKLLVTALGWCCAATQAHQYHFAIGHPVQRQTRQHGGRAYRSGDDIATLLQSLYLRQFDLRQPEDEAVLRKSIEKQFWIEGADQRRLPLHWVGLKAGAETVDVYQEIENMPRSKAALIHDEVRIDFIGAQANIININQNGKIK